jgi:WhiB family redox-sensing transcriptional regulator
MARQNPLDEAWRLQAQYRDTDPAVFFTPDSERSGRGHGSFTYEKAKAHCVGCPVQDECLEHALSVPEVDGVWGGRDERERRAILRQRRVVRGAA